MIKVETFPNHERVLAEYDKKRPEHIKWIKKLLGDGYKFDSRNEASSIGCVTVLSTNGGAKKKEIHHSQPILDQDLR